MKRSVFLTTVFSLLILIAPSGRAEDGAVPPPGKFQLFVEDGRTAPHNADAALPLFDEMMAKAKMGPNGIGSLSNKDLVGLAFEAGVANFYYPGTRVNEHRVLFDEMVKRNLASDVVVDDYYRTLVAARRWEAADDLAKRFPEVSLERIPTLFKGSGDDGGPHYLTYDLRDDSLTRRLFAPHAGVSLIVVSHPNCGFSRDALSEIESNPELKEALPSETIFVAPTFGGLRLDSIWRWNSTHPTTPHVLLDSPYSWDVVREWNTPQFLFLVDGKLVASVEGWPDDSQAMLVIEAARKASVLAQRSSANSTPSPED